MPLAAGETLTLEQAVSIALQHNPELLAARQGVETAKSRVVRAHYLNQFNPQVEAGASQAHFQFAPAGSEAQPSASVSLQVEIAGQRGKRIEEADQNLAKTRAEVADAVRLTKARAQYAFYQALYLRQRLDLMQRIEELNLRLRDASMVRFQSGETPKLEANLAAVRYDQSRKATLFARRDYEDGLRMLQRVLGLRPRGIIEPSGSLSTLASEVDPERALELAMANRPDLRASDFEIKRIVADIALTRRLIVPNPIVRGFADRIADSPGQFIRVLGGSVSISVPLFDRKQAELTALQAQRRRASYERTATELTIEQQLRDAIAAYDAARETVRLFENDAVGRIQESFGLIEGSYRSGKTGLIELIVAENDLVSSYSSYLDSLWDYQVARIGVETAVGVDFGAIARQ
ncbi:MAG TPA: TolC family protein [Candidatus Binataceae bacterium]|nr:TolC family protein [Candidatus Binataceae bacterium]